MARSRRFFALAVAGALALAALSPTVRADPPPQIARGLVAPVGFGVTEFASFAGLLPTSLAWGPDTRNPAGKPRLYVAALDPGLVAGTVFAVDDLGGVGSQRQVFAQGLGQPLGIAFGPDGTLYVSENDGQVNLGRITAHRDSNRDGVTDQRWVVAKGFPTGRHQTNGLAFGPDGMLYVANGNATDDGVECGPEPLERVACAKPERQPWSGALLRVDAGWRDVTITDRPVAEAVAATGMRNIYDVAFRPGDPSAAYIPMNGADDPASNELLYRTDVDDVDALGQPVIDHMGFPSCLYDPHPNPFLNAGTPHAHEGTPEPEDNPNPAVIAAFGRCPTGTVTRPLLSFGGHQAVSGLAFAPSGNFPSRYVGDLFVAQWGSMWNLSGGEVTGHKVVQVHLGPDGRAEWVREFMTAAFPIDVAFGPDGSMYVADFAGTVHRVVHLQDTADTVTVRMVNGQFVPATVVVPRGTTVEWVNEDPVPHSVQGQAAAFDDEPFLRGGADINTDGDIPPGGSHRFRFDQASVWKYRSASSPRDGQTMHGTIVVAPADR